MTYKKVFHTECVGVPIICLHTKFHVLSFNVPSVIGVKLKAKCKFSHDRHVIYIVQNLPELNLRITYYNTHFRIL
jgi:hypothetical protein